MLIIIITTNSASLLSAYSVVDTVLSAGICTISYYSFGIFVQLVSGMFNFFLTNFQLNSK